ncbi:MAG: hypothetical protein RIQ89_363 [Bacteroidota bacterium]|jgi:hypothetical protein
MTKEIQNIELLTFCRVKCIIFVRNLMIRIFICHLLLIGILISSVSQTLIMVEFALNADYIAKNLCRQKAVVDNCCKGTCVLVKELDDDANSDQSNAPTTGKKTVETVLCLSEMDQYLMDSRAGEIRNFHINKTNLAKGYKQSLIKPPSQV